MQAAPITALFAAVLAGLFILLSLRVVGARRGAKVALGTGGDATLERRARVHANFAEYAPFGLLLLFLVETSGVSGWAVAALGALLTTGRCLHAYGVSQAPEDFRYRVRGMVCTLSAIALSAAALLAAGFLGLARG